ncbi:arsenate reductase ArsC [Corynebacterium callunae]|uniref:arsenate reductase ArsC n=1 Tax=Corynebacterium callunae TaxID=1721 RepID=UPI0039819927
MSTTAEIPESQESQIKLLNRVVEELNKKYEGIFSAETIERYVFESYTALARTAKIRTHLPLLAEHFATDRLEALRHAGDEIKDSLPQVLFVCTRNVGRSQIASALLKHYAGGEVHVRSAGILPDAEVHPVVLDVLAERGIDIGKAYPKPLTDDVVRASDYVVNLGCDGAYPMYPGKHYLDWDLMDPGDESPERVRAVVDEIDVHIRELWAEMSK